MTEPARTSARPARRSRPSLKDEAAGYIRDEIFAGRLQPGDRIDQDQIADDLGISRLPVREAIITLAAEGVVQMLPRRGVYVAPLTRDDVLDLYVAFGALSGQAAGRAAERITPGQLDELAALNEAIEASTSFTEQEDLNFRFHQIINRAGSSRRLAALLTVVGNGMPTHFYEFTGDWTPQAVADHRAIIDALRERNVDLARSRVAEHLRRGGDQAVRILESRDFWAGKSS